MTDDQFNKIMQCLRLLLVSQFAFFVLTVIAILGVHR